LVGLAGFEQNNTVELNKGKGKKGRRHFYPSRSYASWNDAKGLSNKTRQPSFRNANLTRILQNYISISPHLNKNQ
jgi:hypothetical protein